MPRPLHHSGLRKRPAVRGCAGRARPDPRRRGDRRRAGRGGCLATRAPERSRRERRHLRRALPERDGGGGARRELRPAAAPALLPRAAPSRRRSAAGLGRDEEPGEPPWTPRPPATEVRGPAGADCRGPSRRLSRRLRGRRQKRSRIAANASEASFSREPTKSALALGRIAAESARFNLGQMQRTTNLPTLPLLYLVPAMQPRLYFSRGGDEEVDGTKTTILEFREDASPTLAASAAGIDMPARGRAWVEPATGRIRRIELRYSAGARRVMTVWFREDRGSSFLAPARMWEWYEKIPVGDVLPAGNSKGGVVGRRRGARDLHRPPSVLGRHQRRRRRSPPTETRERARSRGLRRAQRFAAGSWTERR